MPRTSLGQKLAHLRAKTVARGATPAEAKAAAAKVAELTHAENVVEAEAILVKLSWSEPQARGMVAAFPHLPPWLGPNSWRWPLLYDWASVHEHRDPTALDTQLRFLTDDLRNGMQAIGIAVRAAKTEEEATKAFKPYADKLEG